MSRPVRPAEGAERPGGRRAPSRRGLAGLYRRGVRAVGVALAVDVVLAASVALAVTAALCPAAGADVFEPISLISASPFQQMEYAHDSAISENGRFVAFDGSIGGVTGVWLRELSENGVGGELVQVAGGDAELPSISENGQYVSFTTTEGHALAALTDGRPDTAPVAEAPNVYVRDMSKRPSEPGAFALASDLSYEYSGKDGLEFEETHFGAEAAGRSAISGDGQKVAFVTTAASNLDGAGTPPLQVAVHDFQTGTTEPVSVAYDSSTGAPATDPHTGRPLPVAAEYEGESIYGAVYAHGQPPAFAPPIQTYSLLPEIGASISADGSTMAWMGQDIDEQVPLLGNESLEPQYGEPLWRRIVDAGGQPSQHAPTRRVTGGSDPANPPCAAHPQPSLLSQATTQDPCQGPFAIERKTGVWAGGAGEAVPRLSADGYTVAFLASAPLVALGSGSGGGTAGRHADAYVVDMHEGLSRVQALTPLTELAGGEETHIATNAPILELDISADGKQVAFTTRRTVFPLGSPAYISAPAPVPGLNELFEVDLADDTLTRVSHGYTGGASEHPHQTVSAGEEDEYKKEDDGVLSPALSADGRQLVFASTASNLVFGDGNTPPPLGGESTDGSDVFGVERVLFESTPTPQYVTGAPSLSIAPLWQLGVTAQSLGDGDVLLYVQAPEAGTLGALARGPVRTRSAGASRASRHARRKGAGARAAAVSNRTVATATVRSAASGLTTLLLKLSSGYRALAAQRGGLSATANVTFTAAGHAALHESIPVSFVRAASRRAAPHATRRVVATPRRGNGGRRLLRAKHARGTGAQGAGR